MNIPAGADAPGLGRGRRERHQVERAQQRLAQCDRPAFQRDHLAAGQTGAIENGVHLRHIVQRPHAEGIADLVVEVLAAAGKREFDVMDGFCRARAIQVGAVNQRGQERMVFVESCGCGALLHHGRRAGAGSAAENRAGKDGFTPGGVIVVVVHVTGDQWRGARGAQLFQARIEFARDPVEMRVAAVSETADAVVERRRQRRRVRGHQRGVKTPGIIGRFALTAGGCDDQQMLHGGQIGRRYRIQFGDTRVEAARFCKLAQVLGQRLSRAGLGSEQNAERRLVRLGGIATRALSQGVDAREQPVEKQALLAVEGALLGYEFGYGRTRGRLRLTENLAQ